MRLVHSLKGDAGFLGFTTIRTLANAMETVLEAMRDQEAPISTTDIEQLLIARDRLATLVDDLDNSHGADLSELLAQLEPAATPTQHFWDIDLRLLDEKRTTSLGDFFRSFDRCGIASDPRIVLGPHDLTRGLPQGSIHFKAQLRSSMSVEAIRQQLRLPASAAKTSAETALPLSLDLGEWVRTSGRSLGELLAELEHVGDFQDPQLDVVSDNLRTTLPTAPIVLRGQLRTSLSGDEIRDRLLIPTIDRDLNPPTTDIVAAPLPETHRRLSRPSVAALPVTGSHSASNEENKTASLRVNVELLDRLMTLIGELTLIRNQSLLTCDQDDGPLRSIVQRFSAVTSSLQETVLRTRMQPVGNLFGKFPRVVRDLGRQLGKQVEVTIVGRDVELDKTILEQLADPLTHLVRNSVDHGIEPPEDRVRQRQASDRTDHAHGIARGRPGSYRNSR